MITRLRVQNYKALRDITLDLTPIHVLIGPNDSGKTSLLEALATLCRSVDHPLSQAFVGSWQGADLVWQGDIDQLVGLEVEVGVGERTCTYRFACRFLPTGRNVRIEDEALMFDPPLEPIAFGLQHKTTAIYRIVFGNEKVTDAQRYAAQKLYSALSGVHLYRWVPRLLSLPVAPHSERQFRMESTGFGLALCLDDILGYDRRRFDELENRFKQVFPEVSTIRLIREPAFRSPVDDPEQIPMLQRADGKGLHFRFNGNGQELSASQVSDGVLVVLAYLTILYLPQPPRVLLIEEPENGIHPRRLQDVLQILRELITEQGHTQIILTTHSPYVVDQFQPEEVSLCHKEEDGSVLVHRLSESQTVREQIDLFTLGEIWTAEGDDVLAETTQRRAEASK
jgi:predicted ATPase